MKFESSALAYLLNSDADNEVVAINIPIETGMLLKIFMIYIRSLNCHQDHRHQFHQKWRSSCTIVLRTHLEQLPQAQTAVGKRAFFNDPHFLW